MKVCGRYTRDQIFSEVLKSFWNSKLCCGGADSFPCNIPISMLKILLWIDFEILYMLVKKEKTSLSVIGCMFAPSYPPLSPFSILSLIVMMIIGCNPRFEYFFKLEQTYYWLYWNVMTLLINNLTRVFTTFWYFIINGTRILFPNISIGLDGYSPPSQRTALLTQIYYICDLTLILFNGFETSWNVHCPCFQYIWTNCIAGFIPIILWLWTDILTL
jgi:hypothetical protein